MLQNCSHSVNITAKTLQQIETIVVENYNDQKQNIYISINTGKIWNTRCKMSCGSKNVIYFPTCNRCNGNVSYIGKTVNLRLRTNGHISSIRTGKGTDIFDRHVSNCNESLGPPMEPYFKLYLLISVPEHCLLTYESHFHFLGYDTMNR